MVLQRDNGLLAVVCDDMVVRLVDIETKTVVREFGGFRGRVLDIVWLSTLSPSNTEFKGVTDNILSADIFT